jgi:hypothetical protein
VQRPLRVCATALLAVLASCNRGAKVSTVAAQAPISLAAFAAQRIVVAPTIRVIGGENDPLLRDLGSGSALARYFDGELARQFRDRNLGGSWVMPADLVRAFERNRPYAADPYQLAIEPVRAPRFAAGAKYGEPLSSQLRTMIAMHEDARVVLLPAAIQIQTGRVSLRVALLDPRLAEARWVGDVVSDSVAAPTRASLTQVAGRLAALFAAP